jgi:hypothetical protein
MDIRGTDSAPRTRYPCNAFSVLTVQPLCAQASNVVSSSRDSIDIRGSGSAPCSPATSSPEPPADEPSPPPPLRPTTLPLAPLSPTGVALLSGGMSLKCVQTPLGSIV